MKKIKEFCQKNYIILMTVGIIILVIIASFVLIKYIKNNSAVKSSESVSAYQYFIDSKKTFDLNISYEDENISSIYAKNYDISDNLIYTEDKVILNKEYEIILSNQNGIITKALTYSYFKDNHLYINGERLSINNMVMYDGDNTYFFVNDAILNIEGSTISFTAGSYIWAGSESIILYNYQNDNVTVYNTSSANVKFDDVYIDLYNDTIINGSKMIMLKTNVSDLKVYKEAN